MGLATDCMTLYVTAPFLVVTIVDQLSVLGEQEDWWVEVLPDRKPDGPFPDHRCRCR